MAVMTIATNFPLLNELLADLQTVADEEVAATEPKYVHMDCDVRVGVVNEELRKLFVLFNLYVKCVADSEKRTEDGLLVVGRRLGQAYALADLCSSLFWACLKDSIPELYGKDSISLKAGWVVKLVRFV